VPEIVRPGGRDFKGFQGISRVCVRVAHAAVRGVHT